MNGESQLIIVLVMAVVMLPFAFLFHRFLDKDGTLTLGDGGRKMWIETMNKARRRKGYIAT
jgi:hypothetical protein